MQGLWEEGRAQLRQGIDALVGELSRTYFLALLAAGYGGAGQADEGLATVAEALRLVDKNDERFYEAELHRLKGELTLKQESQKAKVKEQKSKITDPRPLTSNPQAAVAQEAEGYFQKAIEIAQRQQAKSLELRAVMSLVRLRQQQATQQGSRTTQHETRTRLDAARSMLSDIYHWFTEGFDTKDLQEAKTLLEELTH